jgi:simple sugar transport system permease protein
MKMDLTILIGDSLVRIGMNGVLALSMLPTIACGVGLNFGLPVGVIAGLVGAVMSMNWNLQGFAGILRGDRNRSARCHGCRLHLRPDSREGSGTGNDGRDLCGVFNCSRQCACSGYLAPIKNPAMIFAIGGQGLRYTITLDKTFAKVLNNFLAFDVSGVTIPTGLLLFFRDSFVS